MRGNATVIRSNVPLVRLFGYKHNLSSITNGLGSYEMPSVTTLKYQGGMVPTISGLRLA
jgi:translation elongation factor EF-G